MRRFLAKENEEMEVVDTADSSTEVIEETDVAEYGDDVELPNTEDAKEEVNSDADAGSDEDLAELDTSVTEQAEEIVEKAVDDSVTQLVLESEEVITEAAIDSIIELEGEEMRADAAEFLGMQPATEAYQDVEDAVAANNVFHDFIGKQADAEQDFLSKIGNPIANFFTGVNRTLSKSDKLLKEIKKLNIDDVKTSEKYTRKNAGKLMIGDSSPVNIKELIKAVEELTAYGEWMSKEYVDNLHDIVISYITNIQGFKKANVFSYTKAVEDINKDIFKIGFPLAKGSKKLDKHNEVYDTYVTEGLLGGKVIRTQYLNKSAVESKTKPAERVYLFAGQTVNITDFPGVKGSKRLEFEVPTFKELEELLKANEKLVEVAKYLSNELRNKDNLKVTNRMFTAIETGIGQFIHLLARSEMSFMVTHTRRSVSMLHKMLTTLFANTFSSYITNAYQVGSAVNDLVESLIKFKIALDVTENNK